MTALVLAICALLGYPSPPAALVEAIVYAAHTPIEAAELAVWTAHESSFQIEPAPQSWDARAGVSCGPLQMSCARVRGRSLGAQYAMWLSDVRAHGLASVCGYGRSAARVAAARQAQATALLASAHVPTP